MRITNTITVLGCYAADRSPKRVCSCDSFEINASKGRSLHAAYDEAW